MLPRLLFHVFDFVGIIAAFILIYMSATPKLTILFFIFSIKKQKKALVKLFIVNRSVDLHQLFSSKPVY